MGCECDREQRELVSEREAALEYIDSLGYNRLYFDQVLEAFQIFETDRISFTNLEVVLQRLGLNRKNIDLSDSPVGRFYQGFRVEEQYDVKRLCLVVLLECKGTATHKGQYYFQEYANNGLLSPDSLESLLSDLCEMSFTTLPLFAKACAEWSHSTEEQMSIEKYMARLDMLKSNALLSLHRLLTSGKAINEKDFQAALEHTEAKAVRNSRKLREFAISLGMKRKSESQSTPKSSNGVNKAQR